MTCHGCGQVRTAAGEAVQARYVMMATGCLSTANMPDIAGLDLFDGQLHHTGAWPAEGLDVSGLRCSGCGDWFFCDSIDPAYCGASAAFNSFSTYAELQHSSAKWPDRHHTGC